MRIHVLAAACSLAVIGTANLNAAFALDDSALASRFGNTEIQTAADGTVTKYYFNADHTITITVNGAPSKGTWEIKGEQGCFTVIPELPGKPNPRCFPVPPRKIGDTWGRNGANAVLVKGIQ